MASTISGVTLSFHVANAAAHSSHDAQTVVLAALRGLQLSHFRWRPDMDAVPCCDCCSWKEQQVGLRLSQPSGSSPDHHCCNLLQLMEAMKRHGVNTADARIVSYLSNAVDAQLESLLQRTFTSAQQRADMAR